MGADFRNMDESVACTIEPFGVNNAKVRIQQTALSRRKRDYFGNMALRTTVPSRGQETLL
jgi:hypothetical protein